ncbi:MarR family winged helix-turn-helix transcriptional regulator [Paenibacillus sp. P36]|uniref:MarR family winged helix-turn-helix transcriptional regulator n=1 Tax=Paenibacillus sp. P36 TaxID=3342538 RepID=UPI0038B2BD72
MINKQKEPFVREIIASFTKLAQRVQENDDEEHQWLIQHCSNPALIDIIKEMTVMMLHVLDAVGKLEPVNGITISKRFDIPKGSVSKITKKLITLGLIQTESLPGNKKEIIYRTTSLGLELFHLHAQLDRHLEEHTFRVMDKYDADQLRFVSTFLQDLMQTSWIEQEQPPAPIKKPQDPVK